MSPHTSKTLGSLLPRYTAEHTVYAPAGAPACFDRSHRTHSPSAFILCLRVCVCRSCSRCRAAKEAGSERGPLWPNVCAWASSGSDVTPTPLIRGFHQERCSTSRASAWRVSYVAAGRVLFLSGLGPRGFACLATGAGSLTLVRGSGPRRSPE